MEHGELEPEGDCSGMPIDLPVHPAVARKVN